MRFFISVSKQIIARCNKQPGSSITPKNNLHILDYILNSPFNKAYSIFYFKSSARQKKINIGE